MSVVDPLIDALIEIKQQGAPDIDPQRIEVDDELIAYVAQYLRPKIGAALDRGSNGRTTAEQVQWLHGACHVFVLLRQIQKRRQNTRTTESEP